MSKADMIETYKTRHPNAGKFSPEEVEYALHLVALTNVRQAARQLEKEGRRPNRDTLRHWVNVTYADRFAHIRQEELAGQYDRMAVQIHSNIRNELELQEELDAALAGKIKDLDPRDLSTAQRNNAVTMATQFDKARIADELPSAVVEHRDVGEILRALRAKGFALTPDMHRGIDVEILDETDE